jgi:hypothetical protein
VKTGAGIIVYYSTIFNSFAVETERLKSESSALADLFRTNYEIWIGYHAILQENNKPNVNDVEAMEKILEAERAHVARMQVKQALRTAELTRRAMKAEQAGDSTG